MRDAFSMVDRGSRVFNEKKKKKRKGETQQQKINVI